MKVLGIDPGTTESAYVIWDGQRLHAKAFVSNEELLQQLLFGGSYELMAVEMISHMGMPAGRELFETCVFIGRLIERSPVPHELIYRRDVKLHHCNSARAKDGNVRQSIVDRFGGKDQAIGKKASPGPFYGVSSHIWQALALAMVVTDRKS